MKFPDLPNQSGFYQGKVRDVYYVGSEKIVMVASNRISAFDVILPKEIPYKGQVLNQLAYFMLNKTRDICPNWLDSSPVPYISVGKKCTPFKLEMVVRGNLVGHAWRTYQSGKRELCGVTLPEGMKEYDFFPSPIITPSTKAEEGHDEDIDENSILEQGIVTPQEWRILKEYSLSLFERGKQIAAERGLILADTKYEFGKIGDEIYLMDEVHTPDSSRYFYASNFLEIIKRGERPSQLSKEFVREWLIENNFMGKPGQQIPMMSESWINTISDRYIKLYEEVTGLQFQPFEPNESDWEIVKQSL